MDTVFRSGSVTAFYEADVFNWRINPYNFQHEFTQNTQDWCRAYTWIDGSPFGCANGFGGPQDSGNFYWEGEGSSFELSSNVDPENSGSIILDPSGGSYTPGTQVEIEASPSTGYAFSNWEWNDGGSSSTNNPETFVMSGNLEVTAKFYWKADDFIFPVLSDGVTDPLQNISDPIGDGWHGSGVGDYSASYGHLGQDYIIDSGDSSGKAVYAIANGTIVEVMNNQNTSYGWCDNSDHGWGPVVVIRHENKSGFNTTGSIVTSSCSTEITPTVIYSLYGHLSKTSIQNLQIGQKVSKGDQIGVIGAYGTDQESWSTNHLHFEIKDEAGFNEGSWYSNQDNWGDCPEATSQACDAEGIGTAYSHSDGFAPHRYDPGIFIPAN